MRPRIHILTLSLLLLASCGGEKDHATETAAMEVYGKYADHSATLTVAYIGDYKAEDCVYNAVMLQTDDSCEWEWLKAEFGLLHPSLEGMLPADASINPLSMVTMSVEVPDSLIAGLGDGMPPDMNDPEVQAAIMRSLRESGVIPDLPGLLDTTPMPMSGIPGMAGGQMRFEQQDELHSLANRHGDDGYVVSSDAGNNTIWLFFYSNDEERVTLLKKLFKDRQDQDLGIGRAEE